MAAKRPVPKHVAIIMDGNGRWAKKRGLPRLAGHRAGVKNIRRILQAAKDAGVFYITLYAFSTENWSRPAAEVGGLMEILKETVASELDEIHKNDIKIRLIGRWRELRKDLVSELERSVDHTKDNASGVVTLAVNYSGRTELVDAMNAICKEGSADIDEETITRHLYAPDIPDPDLLIRTSGEQRISNFLLWEIAYTEIFVSPTLWPDFDESDFLAAVSDFQTRRRRYGGLDAKDDANV